jgi:hypothetical protein
MVAAGRGVYVGSEVGIRGRLGPWSSAGDFYLLTEPESHFELFAICKKAMPNGTDNFQIYRRSGC